MAAEWSFQMLRIRGATGPHVHSLAHLVFPASCWYPGATVVVTGEERLLGTGAPATEDVALSGNGARTLGWWRCLARSRCASPGPRPPAAEKVAGARETRDGGPFTAVLNRAAAPGPPRASHLEFSIRPRCLST